MQSPVLIRLPKDEMQLVQYRASIYYENQR